MQVKVNKTISILLVMVLILLCASPIISYAVDLESQGTATNNANVTYDVYYEGGTHSNTSDLTSTDAKITIVLSVKNAGYLKNAIVEFPSANFELVDDGTAKTGVQSIDTTNNRVTFNQINNGDTVKATFNIKAKVADTVSSDFFKKDVSANLTGTYVDSNAKENSITSTKTLHQEWKSNFKLALDQNIIKYIPYTVAGKNGLMVQTNVTSNPVSNSLPAKTMEFQVTVPTINNEKPTTAIVVANSTNATNGDATGSNFTTSNWSYDATTGIVKIDLNNDPDSNGNISWKKDAQDEFLITYIYSPAVYTAVKDTGASIAQNVAVSATTYSNNNTTYTGSADLTQTIVAKTGDIVDFNTTASTSLNKGYMYNNKNATADNQKETEYSVNYVANISYAQLSDGINFTQKYDNFVSSSNNSTTVSGTNYAYDKSVSIDVNTFNKILGTNGTITILNDAGTTIGTINSTTTATNGLLTVDISSANSNDITIKTSAPQAEGKLTLTVNKAISKNVDYSVAQLNKFTTLSTALTGNAVNASTVISTEDKTANITLNEPTAKATISTSVTNLSTVTANNNVEIKAVLEADSIDDVMYKDPTIKIVLPEYIDTFTINSTNLLYGNDELTISGTPEVVNNADGTKTLTIKTTGTVTKYSDGSVSKGPTIIVNANIVLNKLTPSKEETISMNVSDSNSVSVDATSKVEYVAPAGVVTINGLSGYSASGADISLVSSENSTNNTATLDVNSVAKTATVSGEIINNYANNISNTEILGRIPNTGVSADTFNTPLTGAINVTGEASTVYYSTKADATKDLTDANNGWVATVTDYSTVKSYLIVANSAMAQGTQISFNYKITIPENLKHNNDATLDYIAYYVNNNATTGNINETQNSPKISLTTGTAAILESTLTSDAENNIVKQGQYVQFTATVKNTGSVSAEDVVMNINVPDGTTLVYYEKSEAIFEKLDSNVQKIGEIKANETKTITYYLKINSDAKIGTDTINPSIKFTGSNFDEITSDLKLSVQEGKIEIIQGSSAAYDNYYLTKGNPLDYRLVVNNISGEDQTNVKISFVVPNGLTINTDKTGIETSTKSIDTTGVTIDGNTVTYTIDSLTKGSYKVFIISTKIGDIDTATTVANAYIGSDKYTSNTLTYEAQKASVNVEGIAPDNQYVKVGDNVSYKYTIKNDGNTILKCDQILFNLPDGVSFKDANLVSSLTNKTYTYSSLTDTNTLTINDFYINTGDTVTLTVNTTANDLSENKDKDIVGKLTVTTKEAGEKTANVKYTIEYVASPDDNGGNNGGNNGSTTSGYKITGKVWLDVNKDGTEDDTEVGVSGVTTLLLDTENNNKEINNTTTSSDGTYEFDNVANGKYLVVFFYDNSVYTTTEYKKTGVAETVNSDATNTSVTYNGETKIAGVTDVITISNDNSRNIDLGLVESGKFDLKLTKGISKITTNTPEGTQTYDYTSEPKSLAKIELPSKYLDSSTIVVEYNIKVTNVGNVSGYAKKIADYLPSDMKFSSELNTNWYLGTDGNAYNMELANTEIKPGETKEVTIILTKKMTKDNTGIYNNNAEIYESYNAQGIASTSTAGNKVATEDDMSTANLIVSVKTGQVKNYIILSISILAVIGTGIFIIKKKVLDKKV